MIFSLFLYASGSPQGTKETFGKKFLWTLQKLLVGLRRFVWQIVFN
jgi:hypothetical protein